MTFEDCDALLARLQTATVVSGDDTGKVFADASGAVTLRVGNGVSVVESGAVKSIPADYPDLGSFVALYHGATPTAAVTEVSPVEFKMLFTPQERIAIRAAREDTSTENATVKAFLDDWFDIVDDPRLSAVNLQLQSTIDGVNYLATIGIITAERAGQVLAGEIQ